MSTDRTDRDLVAALLGGDRAALGSIYDRYGASLYDTAAAMLRDRDEAADAVQEVFLVAAHKLDQLRDPDRLKSWLFAVLRHEVFRRTKHRSRARPTDFSEPGASEMAAPTDPTADAGAIERDELAAFVRDAAAGLDARDQLVMELSMRQDLTGDDLAAAVGVTTKQAHVLVHRMRDRLLRSLGALTVARMGRDDCDELAALLTDWDGTFSVLVRKRVARHVDRCGVCDDTRSRLPAGALFGAAPAFAAPADLRDAVLTAATRPAPPTSAPEFDRHGFPIAPGSSRVRPALAVAAAIVVLCLAAGAGYLVGGRSTTVAAGPVAATSSTTEPSSATITTIATTTTVPAPASTEPATTEPPSSVTPPTQAPTPGSVVVSTTVLDLGDTADTASLTISNPGQTTVEWVLARTGSSPFVWEAVTGRLGPGESRSLAVSVDRDPLDEGARTGGFTLSGGGESVPVQVRARVERPPVIDDVRGPSSISCSSSTRPLVSASITDESPIASVVLRWSGPGGEGSDTMTDRGDGRHEGTLRPERRNGNWTFTVVATDSRGNQSEVSRPFVITGCSGGSGGGGGFTT